MTKLKGMTIVELLMALVIIGIIISMVLPRAIRATQSTKFSLIRQHATEIAGHTVKWTQEVMESQGNDSPYTQVDIMLYETQPELTGLRKTLPVVNHYTGSPNFNGVERTIDASQMPVNPFNEASYFRTLNNDILVPSKISGLLYLTTALDPDTENMYRMFYFFITGIPKGSQFGTKGRWYREMGGPTPTVVDADTKVLEWAMDDIRRGIFVARMPVNRSMPLEDYEAPARPHMQIPLVYHDDAERKRLEQEMREKENKTGW